MVTEKRKLILVEGLPGTGKSTTSQWLHQSFTQQGGNTRWYHEMSHDHPLKQHSELEKNLGFELIPRSLEMWSYFASLDMSDQTVVIIDSGFFQKDVMYMMSQDTSEEEILSYSKRVEEIFEKFDPYLVYLSHGNTSEHVRNTYRNRGSTFEKALIEWSTSRKISLRKGYQGLDGSIEFWNDYKELCDRVFVDCSFKKINIDISEKKWKRYQLILSSLFGLQKSLSEFTPNSSDINKLEGIYVMPGTENFVEVSGRQGELKITNLLHALEHESVMIPIRKDVFKIRGHDVELQFNKVESENSILIDVKSSWSKINGDRFKKISQSM